MARTLSQSSVQDHRRGPHGHLRVPLWWLCSSRPRPACLASPSFWLQPLRTCGEAPRPGQGPASCMCLLELRAHILRPVMVAQHMLPPGASAAAGVSDGRLHPTLVQGPHLPMLECAVLLALNEAPPPLHRPQLLPGTLWGSARSAAPKSPQDGAYPIPLSTDSVVSRRWCLLQVAFPNLGLLLGSGLPWTLSHSPLACLTVGLPGQSGVRAPGAWHGVK